MTIADSVKVEYVAKAKRLNQKLKQRIHTVIRNPSFNDVSRAPDLYAHVSRVLHLETNPGNARPLVQNQGG